MVVTTGSEEVQNARRTALELLFSDHAGMCVAPCSMSCPARLDVPGFLAHAAVGDIRAAMAVVMEALPLPAVLGRVCAAYCEAPCMRKHVDDRISVRLLHRYVADVDLASADPYLPRVAPSSGKRVAVVGGGAAGLSAAWFLLRQGHGCVVFEAGERAGGLLRRIGSDKLDPRVLDAEIARIVKLGAGLRFGWRLGETGTLEALRGAFDAVLVACGAASDEDPDGAVRRIDPDFVASLGLDSSPKGIAVDHHTHATGPDGVFAAGEAVTGQANTVRAVAAGRDAATAIDQYLTGKRVTGSPKPFYFGRFHPSDGELRLHYGAVAKAPRAEAGADGLSDENARGEAARCLQCTCAAEDSCKLREYGERFSVRPYRFKGERRELAPDHSHAEVVYEPGKCILCGLCLEIAKEAGENPGLSFAGRGFPTRVVAALSDGMSESLKTAARECADACPTAAFSIKEHDTKEDTHG